MVGVEMGWRWGGGVYVGRWETAPGLQWQQVRANVMENITL
jgi:hypothetical protein